MRYAVVVARAGTRAKSRLAPLLEAAQRSALVVGMTRDVLAACARSPLLEGTIVVADALVVAHLAPTPTPRTAHPTPSGSDGARLREVEVVADPGEMNAAARAGIEAARARGADCVIVLPADIPLVTPDDLRRMLEAAGDAPCAVVVGASRDGHGTNALLLRPPSAIAPSFGPPSVERHVSLATAAGCHPVVLRDLRLALDVDTPADLAALQAAPHLPPHTAEVLGALSRI